MIEQELRAELKDAMLNKDVARREVIREVMTQVTKKKAEPGFSGEADDQLHLDVMASFVKKSKKVVAEYEGYGERGAEMVGKLNWEIDYVSKWLPEKMSSEAVTDLVQGIVSDLGVAGDPRAMGRVIGMVMKDHKDVVDGGELSQIVKQELGLG
jgi:uncharacterized protein YqeY